MSKLKIVNFVYYLLFLIFFLSFNTYRRFCIKIEECGLSFFFIFFLILFSFQFIFPFSIFRTLGLGLEVISHTVTSVTIWWCGHNIGHETWENKVEGSRTKWCHTTWSPYVDLMLYTWSFRAGCTVASMDHQYKYIR